MRRLLADAALYAEWRAPLIIQGEIGTGKTWLARRIHEMSPRRQAYFGCMNLAHPEVSLAGSELFGHVLGGFTDAKRNRRGLLVESHGGTAFFDELGKSPLVIQHKLMQVLDEPTFTPVGADRPVTVDVRFIFAAREPLDDLVASGAMSADFRSRISAFVLRVPSLRERREDVVPLARWFVEVAVRRKSERPRTQVPALSDALCEALEAHEWPENVRELENLMLKLVIFSRDARVLELHMLDEVLVRPVDRAMTAEERLASRRERALGAMRSAGGKRKRAAELLGWSYSTFQRVMRGA
jgi:DNA-binding NtrC family response regulator